MSTAFFLRIYQLYPRFLVGLFALGRGRGAFGIADILAFAGHDGLHAEEPGQRLELAGDGKVYTAFPERPLPSLPCRPPHRGPRL